jgi:hypothetical protein
MHSRTALLHWSGLAGIAAAKHITSIVSTGFDAVMPLRLIVVALMATLLHVRCCGVGRCRCRLDTIDAD